MGRKWGWGLHLRGGGGCVDPWRFGGHSVGPCVMKKTTSSRSKHAWATRVIGIVPFSISSTSALYAASSLRHWIKPSRPLRPRLRIAAISTSLASLVTVLLLTKDPIPRVARCLARYLLFTQLPHLVLPLSYSSTERSPLLWSKAFKMESLPLSMRIIV